MKKAIAAVIGFAWILAILLHIVASHVAANETVTVPEKPSVWKEIADIESGWKWFTEDTLGFAIQVPESSRMEGGPSGRIRIQNYSEDDESRNLKPNAFWLEIFFEQSQITNEKRWISCPGEILDPRIDIKNGVKVYTGAVEDESGDAGGRMEGLCVDTGIYHIWMQAAENNKHTPILKKIFRSFRFISRRGKGESDTRSR